MEEDFKTQFFDAEHGMTQKRSWTPQQLAEMLALR